MKYGRYIPICVFSQFDVSEIGINKMEFHRKWFIN